MSDKLFMPAMPYKGIESYSYKDRNIFAERSSESLQIMSLINIYRGCLLYAPSGAGKSSLVRAGLTPLLLQSDNQPVIIRIKPESQFPFVLEKIFAGEEQESAFFEGVADEKHPISLNDFREIINKHYKKAALPEHVAGIGDSRKPVSGQKSVVLIFDQFEELVTLFEESGKKGIGSEISLEQRISLQEEIILVLQELYYSTELKIKLLFIFREDYLAKFTKIFEIIPDLSDHFLRLRPFPKENLSKIISYPFEQDKEGKYQPPFTVSFIKDLADKLNSQFDENDISLTDVQIVCLFLYNKKDEEVRNNYLLKDRPIHNIIEEYYRDVLNRLGDRKGKALSLLILLVLNEKTRNIFHENAIFKDFPVKDNDFIADILKELLRNRLIRKETRRDGAYYEISSEAIIPWINKEKIKKEKERAERKSRKNIGIVAIIFLIALTLTIIQIRSLKNANKNTTNMAMLFKANDYLKDGDLINAFGIYGYLMHHGSESIRKQTKKAHLDYTDIPGLGMYTLKNGNILSVINDSTLQLWKIPSADSFFLIKEFSHVNLRAIKSPYFAVYANKQLVLYNSETQKEQVIADSVCKAPHFAFSLYADYLSYDIDNAFYIVDLKNNNNVSQYLLSNKYNSAIKNILYTSPGYVYSFYSDYMVLWESKDDSLIANIQKSKSADKWVSLGGDSVLSIDKQGITICNLKKKTSKIVYKDNLASYSEIENKSGIIMMSQVNTHNNSDQELYSRLSFYNSARDSLKTSFKSGQYKNFSINADYTNCLISDSIGNVYFLDTPSYQLKPLDSLNGCEAYDISDNGEFILYVKSTASKQSNTIKNLKPSTSVLYLYDLTKKMSVYIDEILPTNEADSFGIYGRFYFRFSSSSDKFAYVKSTKDLNTGDSSIFIVRSIAGNHLIFKSNNIDRIIDDRGRTDFTADYIHVHTLGKQEGIILLNGIKRTPEYYSKFYKETDQHTWDTWVKELGFDFN